MRHPREAAGVRLRPPPSTVTPAAVPLLAAVGWDRFQPHLAAARGAVASLVLVLVLLVVVVHRGHPLPAPHHCTVLSQHRQVLGLLKVDRSSAAAE